MADEKDWLGDICFFDNPEAIIPVGGIILLKNVTIQDMILQYACLKDGQIVPKKLTEITKDEKVIGAVINEDLVAAIKSSIRVTMSNDTHPVHPLPENKDEADQLIASWAVHDLWAGSGVHGHAPTGARFK